MHDLYENLEQLCETVADEIAEANEKVKSSGGKLSSGDVEYLDKLTHMLKSIKTTKAMMDAEEGYSSDYDGGNTMNMNGGSYARGRGRNARRDSMGRYSSEGRSYNSRMMDNRSYDGMSYDGDMVSELRELMEEAPNKHIRQKFQQFISEIERMK